MREAVLPLIPVGNIMAPPSFARVLLERGGHIAPEFLRPGETEQQALERVEALYRAAVHNSGHNL